MQVGFNVHPYAMHVKGGGEIQLLTYVELLRKRGVTVHMHDIWNPLFSSMDIFHHFHMLSGGLPFLHYINGLNIPIFLSTNIWIDGTNVNNINKAEIVEYLSVARRFIANSQAEIENIAQNIGCDVSHGRVVYNGVSPEFAQPVDQSEYIKRLPFTGRYVLNVANVEHRKNQLRIAEAAKQLDLPVVCIGGVRDPEYLEACKRANDKFHYLGSVQHDDPMLRAAMQHADVFVLASTFETPGLAALEAGVAGCEVVITSEGATREYFGPFAHYVNPQSVDSITSALESAFSASKDSPELREHLLDNYAWDKISESLVECYQDVLK